MKSKWSQMLGEHGLEDDEDGQDSIKQALLETSPILLGTAMPLSTLVKDRTFRHHCGCVDPAHGARVPRVQERHSVLAHSQESRGSLRALGALQRVPVRHRLPVHLRQRQQLGDQDVDRYRLAHRVVEDPEVHGRAGIPSTIRKPVFNPTLRCNGTKRSSVSYRR